MPVFLTSYSNVDGVMRKTVERFGRIDVLLKNTAIYVTWNSVRASSRNCLNRTACWK
ncbi:MAG: hypothetical protein HY695_12950 [Deltaproteobacteria bacterium]|nr:hypothetical protein [Deltaproteobacteria bacterium]